MMVNALKKNKVISYDATVYMCLQFRSCIYFIQKYYFLLKNLSIWISVITLCRAWFPRRSFNC